MNGKKDKRKERRRKVNKEEMNNRIQENVQPKYNREKNLNEIKENLTFTDEKEIMENMITEKQNQTKKIRWIALFSIIFACIILIGSNCITYFASSNNKEVLVRDKKQNIVENYFIENEFENYSSFARVSIHANNEIEFSLYQGEKNNIIRYVYYMGALFVNQNTQLKAEVTDNIHNVNLIKEKEDQYTIGELMLENIEEGSQLTIKFYKNEEYIEEREVII